MDIKLGRVKNRTHTTFASKRLKSSWLIRKQKGLLTWAILTSASLWYRALHSSVLQEWMRSRHILPDTRHTRYMTPHNGKSDLSPVRRQTAYERPLRVHGLSIRPLDLNTQPSHPEGSENTDTAPSTRRGDVPSRRDAQLDANDTTSGQQMLRDTCNMHYKAHYATDAVRFHRET